jgi:hypothetical protein
MRILGYSMVWLAAVGLLASLGCGKGGTEKKAGPIGADDAKARLQIVTALKNMALALNNYSATSGGFLPTADGSPTKRQPKLAGMSWRVYLLPFLEEMEVYRKLEEGKLPLAKDAKPTDVWNRPDLAKLSGSIFSSPIPGKTKEGWDTFYRVFIGNGAGFEAGKQLHIPKDFPDGTDKTIAVVEAAEAVPWTKPDELSYDAKKPLPKLGGLFPDGFYAAFFDGNVRLIPHDTDEKTLRAMITRNGGEPIDKLPPIADLKELQKAAGVKVIE